MPERPAARYLPLNRKQRVLRPLDLEHLVDEDHPVRKSFRRSDGVRTYLAAARRHIEELEREEADEQTTKRQHAAHKCAAREREQRIEEAQAEIERLRASKKGDKRKQPQASTTDPTARFMRNGDGGLGRPTTCKLPPMGRTD